jgi:hypothetical protein
MSGKRQMGILSCFTLKDHLTTKVARSEAVDGAGMWKARDIEPKNRL